MLRKDVTYCSCATLYLSMPTLSSNYKGRCTCLFQFPGPYGPYGPYGYPYPYYPPWYGYPGPNVPVPVVPGSNVPVPVVPGGPIAG